MEELEKQKLSAEIDKLTAETVKLEIETQRLLMLNDRDGWRLLFYGIGTGGGIIAVLLGATKLFGG